MNRLPSEGEVIREFEKLREFFENDEATKRDMVVPLNELTMEQTGKLRRHARGGVEGLALSDYAMGQAFSRLGIPVAYGRKLMKERPDLVATQFNHWTSKETRQVLVRMRIHENGQGVIRGFLSDRYSILDNKDVFDGLSRIIETTPEAELTSTHIDDRRAHIRLSFPELSADFGLNPEGKPDILRVGVDIVNSEVGASSLRITPVVYRLVCTNGLKGWAPTGERFVQRHMHLTTNELYGRMSTAVVDAIRGGDTMIETLQGARKTKVEEPLDIIKELAAKQTYSQTVTDTAQRNFLIEPEPSLYGIMNAFTRTARDLPNERRLEMEEFAGSLLGKDTI